MAEAGWYYVEGDPPGTVRRWNGVEWIGFPIPDPSGQAGGPAMHGARPSTRKRFTATDQTLAVLTVASLTVLAGLFALTTVRVWQGAQAMPATDRPESGRVGELGQYIHGLGVLSTALFIAVLVSAVTFIPWIRAAAATAQIQLIKGSSGAKKRQPLPLAVNIVLFLLFPGPRLAWWILTLAVEGVARGHNRQAGMLGVVSDTAMAASTDPRTGLASISPVKILVWWAFWWLPVIVGILSWTAVWILSPITDTVLQTFVELNAILLGLEVISLLCIIATVVQISARLWR